MKGRLQTPRQNGDRESRETGLALPSFRMRFHFYLLRQIFFRVYRTGKTVRTCKRTLFKDTAQNLNHNGGKA